MLLDSSSDDDVFKSKYYPINTMNSTNLEKFHETEEFLENNKIFKNNNYYNNNKINNKNIFNNNNSSFKINNNDDNNNNDSNNNNNNYNNNYEDKLNEKTFYDDDNEIQTPSSYSSNCQGIIAQCMVVAAVLAVTASAGMPIGYSAILLPQLNNTNSTLKINENLGSWIASIHSLSSPIGSLLSGPLLDLIGRKTLLQIATIPLCLGWILIGFSSTQHIWLMLVGRIFCGTAVGLTAVAGQVLVGECSDAGIRGFLMSLLMVAYSSGIAIVYILGVFNWRTVAFSSIILPIIALISMTFITESPAWLVKHNKINEAKLALLWLRGNDEKQVNLELTILENRSNTDLFIKKNKSKINIIKLITNITSGIKTNIFHSEIIKPLVIINLFFLLQVLSGTYLIVFYGVDIIRDIGGEEIDNYIAGILMAVVRIICCGISCILFLKIGRRTIALISASGTALSSLILAGFFMKNNDSYIDKYIVIICVFMYVCLNTIGLMTLPGLLIGELLPQRARGVGGGFTMFLFNFALFGVAKIFPMIKNAIGIAGVFGIFGIAASLETLFTWLVLPETKNRTLQDIEDYFKDGNILWISKTRRKC